MRRQGNSDPRPLLPNALPGPLTCLLPGQKLPTMAPVPAGQALYHLQVICMKNSKALFSSEHVHPRCPMASVTQTITPSPQAPPWLGGGDTGRSTQGFAPCQAPGSRARSSSVALERGAQAAQRGTHSISQVKLKLNGELSNVPGNLTVSAPKFRCHSI